MEVEDEDEDEDEDAVANGVTSHDTFGGLRSRARQKHATLRELSLQCPSNSVILDLFSQTNSRLQKLLYPGRYYYRSLHRLLLFRCLHRLLWTPVYVSH
jgi:hypothetical protein